MRRPWIRQRAVQGGGQRGTRRHHRQDEGRDDGRVGREQRQQGDEDHHRAPRHAAGPIAHGEPHVARFGLGQREVIAAAIAADHGADIAPVHAIVRQLHQIIRSVLVGLPPQHYAPELAQRAEVERQLGVLLSVQVRRPGGIRLAIDGQRRSAGRAERDLKIVCGHWSTLGLMIGHGVHAIDTGAVWGGKLTALQLDTDEIRLRSRQ